MRSGELGIKHDLEKSRIDLITPAFIEGIGEVLRFGAEKYGDRNWEEGILYSRVYAAAMRHLLAFWQGKVSDSESGLHHLLHAGCCIMFLYAYEDDSLRYQEWDNRP